MRILLLGSLVLVLAACGGESGDGHEGHDHSQHQQGAEPAQDAASDQAVTPYPLDTCLVTGADLDSMGGPVVAVYDGQEIKFCCAGCKPQFEAKKAEYLAELAAVTADDE